MKDLIGEVGLDNVIEVGEVRIDNPIVELAVGAAAVAVFLYTGYKVLTNKKAAENFATAFGTKAKKDS